MMKQYEQISPSPSQRSNRNIVKFDEEFHYRRGSSAFHRLNKIAVGISTFFRSILSNFTVPTTIRRLSITPSLGRKVTGTLFGNRRGLVSFSVQDAPRSEPALVVELPVTTADLVKEMASGMMRIALECEKFRRPIVSLFREPVWTMYCNGRMCGHARGRACSESDWHVLRTVQSVSSGAGMIPVLDDGASEGALLYMRARVERVVGNRDSVAFYMVNEDGTRMELRGLNLVFSCFEFDL